MDTNWAAEMSEAHRAERAEWARQIAESDAARAKLAERCGRLESDLAVNAKLLARQCDLAREAEADLAAASRGAIRAGETIAQLRARVAELEAALDADGCAECDGVCDDCESEVA